MTTPTIAKPHACALLKRGEVLRITGWDRHEWDILVETGALPVVARTGRKRQAYVRRSDVEKLMAGQ